MVVQHNSSVVLTLVLALLLLLLLSSSSSTTPPHGVVVAAAAAAAGSVRATPELSLGIGTKKVGFDGASKLGGLEPILKWTAKGTAPSEVDWEGGVTFTVQDADKIPYNFWGKVKKRVSGWNLAAKVDSSSTNLSKWGVHLQASHGSTSLQVKGKVHVDASEESEEESIKTCCRADVQVGDIQLTQSKIPGPAGTSWTVSPRLNVPSQEPDLTVSCDGSHGTTVTVEAGRHHQKVTVRQTVGPNNVVIPSVTNDGQVELEYRRTLPTGGTIAATIQPYVETGALELEWKDGPWSATAKAPLSQLTDVQFNLRRTVEAF